MKKHIIFISFALIAFESAIAAKVRVNTKKKIKGKGATVGQVVMATQHPTKNRVKAKNWKRKYLYSNLDPHIVTAA